MYIILINGLLALLLAGSCQQKKAVDFPAENMEYPYPNRFSIVPRQDSLSKEPIGTVLSSPKVNSIQTPQESSKKEAHPNIHKIPEHLTRHIIDSDSLLKSTFITAVEDPATHFVINSLGDTIPTGSWMLLVGADMDFPPMPSTPGSRPRFKDRSTSNIQYLDVDQGMASSYVLSIIEDKDGALWFGHLEGVSRYDGVNFTHYTQKDGFLTVWCSLLASDGTLWFGTFGGIIKYDGKRFIRYSEETGLLNDEIKSITEDSQGNIWFGSLAGLTKYDGSSFMHYTSNEGLLDETVNALLEDRNGVIWLGTENGVISFDGTLFEQYTVNNGLSHRSVISIFEDSNGNLWFGTDGGGVNRFDGESFVQYTTQEGLSHDVVRSIVEDDNGVLWFNTDGGGANQYTGDRFITYQEREGLYADVYASFVDNSGKLWFGTNGGGVSVLAPNSFSHLSEEEGLSNSYVYAIAEDRHGNLWFGTDGGGVNKYDGQLLIHFTEKDGLAGNSIASIIEDSHGNLWFGTSFSGLSKFDGENFVNYNESHGLPSNSIQAIQEDEHGGLWLGTDGAGVLWFDGERFLQFTTEDGLSDDIVNAIIQDKKGDLWFGTDNGLTKFNGEVFTRYSANEGFDVGDIIDLTLDHSGNIWIATRGSGVFRFDGIEFIQYTTSEGLSSDVNWSIVEDHNHHIWATSEKGLNEFIPKSPDGMYKIIYYQQGDGLKGIDFLTNSICLDHKNQLWLGSGKSLTMVDLNTHQKPQHIPNVFLRQLDINGKMIDYQKSEKNEDIGIHYDSVQRFENYPINAELTAENNHLTFHFTAIDWQSPFDLEYSFVLDGFENEWSSPIVDSKVDYRNIPPGDYTFRVRARGKSQLWSEEATLQFSILPPWYQTWWAYSLYVALIILIGYSYTYWRTQSLLRQKKMLEDTVASRTADLKKQKEEIEIQAFELEKLNDLKSKFYSVVGHDLRSPLTKLFATVFNIKRKLAIKDEETSKAFSEFDNLYHNFNELLDNVLDWGLIDSNSKKVVLESQYLDEIVENIVELYQPQAIDKNIDLIYNASISEDLQVNIDKGSMEIVLRNLISNALKFTYEGGSVSVQTSAEEQFVYVKVKDSGIGITEDKLETIFEITEKKQTTGTKGEKGTGLGLKLAHDFVLLNKGEINIDSTPGIGTSITIKLPLD